MIDLGRIVVMRQHVPVSRRGLVRRWQVRRSRIAYWIHAGPIIVALRRKP